MDSSFNRKIHATQITTAPSDTQTQKTPSAQMQARKTQPAYTNYKFAPQQQNPAQKHNCQIASGFYWQFASDSAPIC
ncbi:hypothetical protein BKN38_05670 [Helicobacter sp. CLO-3]|nr:hypothetical protein BA723_03275 [Helicobacter sp. CLO-3]OHU83197.1 hypothetical protein BKN38_05670 [Helicobacter sp. CLO-3]